uniref:NAC domain-containing protein n=1 Tax=Glycine max TaxID=3847 RepID=C6TF01_SOYBN|nr:unknown [Glycine max]
MAGTSWLVDKSRIATKIKCASGACDHGKVIWKSNPTKACPNCQHAIDNGDVAQEWPGLPKGVKFDPSDQEIIWHLLAKVGVGDSKSHPFIDEFITTLEVDPVTPKLVTPEPPCNGRWCADLDLGQETHNVPQPPRMDCLDEIQADCQVLANESSMVETQHNEGMDDKENNAEDGQKWWDSESQNLLDSQQLVEALSLCDDLLQSQSPSRDGKHEDHKNQPGLSVYAQLGPEHLKKDIEECQNLALNPANIENDTPSEFQLSQLEFGSQDSFISWGYSKAVN